jgi:outer membrane protein
MALSLRCLTGIGLVLALSAGAATAETLEDALRLARASNPQLAAERTSTELARERLEFAKSQGRTTVALSGSAGYESTDTDGAFSFGVGDRPTANVQLQAVKPVYTGGRIASGVRQARAGIDAAAAQFEAAEQDLVLQVITAYVDVRRDRETVSIRSNNVQVTGEQVRAATDRFAVGVVTRTDVALSNARLEGARAALAGAEAQLESSLATYAFLVGAPADALAPPPPVPPLPTSLEDATARGLARSPDIAAARFAERAANEAIEGAKAGRRASINIVGTAGAQETFGDTGRQDTSVTAVAQGRIPLINGGQVNSQVRTARLQRDQARLQIDGLERQVRAQTAQAFYGYQAALKAIEASVRQVEAADIAYTGAKEELSVGVRTTLDVLDQEQQLFEAKLAVVRAERDAYVAGHRLLRAIGELK